MWWHKTFRPSSSILLYPASTYFGVRLGEPAMVILNVGASFCVPFILFGGVGASIDDLSEFTVLLYG